MKLWSGSRACLLPLFAIVASATPITFTFAGHVMDDAINGCGGLVNCGAATGSYTFDSTSRHTFLF